MLKGELKPIMETASNGIAVGAISMPAWYDHLQEASQIAALILPILGAAWLIIQIVVFFWTGHKPKD